MNNPAVSAIHQKSRYKTGSHPPSTLFNPAPSRKSYDPYSHTTPTRNPANISRHHSPIPSPISCDPATAHEQRNKNDTDAANQVIRKSPLSFDPAYPVGWG